MALHSSAPQPRRHARGRRSHSELPPHEQPWIRRAATLPVGDALGHYIEHFLEMSSFAPSTAYYYKRHLAALSRTYPGKPPSQYTTLDLTTFIAARSKDKAPSTRKTLCVVIRNFFRWLHQLEVIPRDPAALIKTPRVPPAEPRYLDQGDVSRLLRAAHRDLAFQAVIALAAYAGLRRGSIHSLKWDDVDFDARTITVRHAKNGRHYIVPMAPKLRTILQCWRDASKGNDCGYVYAHPHKGSWRPYYYTRTNNKFHKYAERAGISPEAGLHDLRRTFATTLHNNGVDIAVISRLLGHADISTTMKHYAFTLDESKKEAVLTLDY